MKLRTPMHKLISFSGCFLLINCLSASPALAIDPHSIPAGKPVNHTRKASREEIISCIRENDDLANRFKNAQAAVAENYAGMNKIQAEELKLSSEQGKVNRDDEMEVAQLNARLQEHNRFVAALNAKAEVARGENAAYNLAMAAHKKRCAGLVYNINEYRAILQELREKRAVPGQARNPSQAGAQAASSQAPAVMH